MIGAEDNAACGADGAAGVTEGVFGASGCPGVEGLVFKGSPAYSVKDTSYPYDQLSPGLGTSVAISFIKPAGTTASTSAPGVRIDTEGHQV